MCSLTGNITCSWQSGNYLGNLQWHSVTLRIPSVRTGSSFHPFQCSGGHLSACHAINTIVYENHNYILAPVAGMNSLGCTNGSQVTIPLIGKDILVGTYSLNCCA